MKCVIIQNQVIQRKLQMLLLNKQGYPQSQSIEPIQGEVDLLFLGTGIYAFDIDPELKEYISTLNPANIKMVVVFSTAAIVQSAYEKAKKYLQKQGLNVSDKEYHCPGHYMILRTGRPNADDVKYAEQFAKSIINSL